MAYLVLLTEGQSGPRFILEKSSVTIGRSPECDIHLEDPSVSFQHAQLSIENLSDDGGEIWIEDINSTNGTFVNNDKVNRRQLRNNDSINIGLSNFRFVDEGFSTLENTQQIKKSWIPGVYYLKDKSA
ncbi:FHA domain-containing protein [Pleionea litopenaei]|uniref:FHA domain-containing protein n=1 Tax=Pleionea litopenaei TaxID=3070815 RepID=A0AA51RST4_9GAMM|nr:FHA domain-containing protein [Pleionea sp. HL-JVS1]WMS86870.1 FHA domain-containing protein [Pleionea sp. HL-JVS1]